MLTASMTATQWICVVLLGVIALLLLLLPRAVWRVIQGKPGKDTQPDPMTVWGLRGLGVLIGVGVALLCWRLF